MKLLTYNLLIFGVSCLLWRLGLRWYGVWTNSLESKGASRWFGWCRILVNRFVSCIKDIGDITSMVKAFESYSITDRQTRRQVRLKILARRFHGWQSAGSPDAPYLRT